MTLASTWGVPARSAGAPSRAGAHVQGRKLLFWPFVLPAIILYVGFLVAPTLAAVYFSFTKWSGQGEADPAGFTQYRRLLTSEAFQHSFLNTFIYCVVGGVGTFVVAFLFTMVLRDLRGGKLIRSILFFPNIVAPVALGIFFGLVYRFQPGRQGMANALLERLGIPPYKFLREDNLTVVVMVTLIWASAGFYITILMAAVDRIPPHLYEDADVAGASPWQKFRNITLPMTWDVVSVAGVLWTISAVKIFEVVYVMASAGTYSPPIKTWTMGIYVYDRSFGSTGTPDFGAACACGVLMMLLMVLLVLSLRRLMHREVIQF